MTVALDLHPLRTRTTETTTPDTWSSPAGGLWVAQGAEGYRGMIELRGSFYVASGPDNHHLGTFRSLNQAKRAVDPSRAEGAFADPDDRADFVGAMVAAVTGLCALAAAVTAVVNLVG